MISLHHQIARLQPTQQRAVLDFIERHTRVHRHLNWRPMREWLCDDGALCFVAHQQAAITGVVAFSRPIAGQSWLRLLALHDDAPLYLGQQLIEHGCAALSADDNPTIYLLQMAGWLIAPLVGVGFDRVNELVHLKRPANLPVAETVSAQLRPVSRGDLPDVAAIDQAAFAAPWQMEDEDVQAAYAYASHFLMAMVDGQPVGYHLATTYPGGVHLARLATLPAWHGRGIGRQLVLALIYRSRGLPITVNTQADNHASRWLYERLGFALKPDRTPVWRRTACRNQDAHA